MRTYLENVVYDVEFDVGLAPHPVIHSTSIKRHKNGSGENNKETFQNVCFVIREKRRWRGFSSSMVSRRQTMELSRLFWLARSRSLFVQLRYSDIVSI